MPRRSNAACTLPSSPQRPCSAMNTVSAAAHTSSTRSPKRLRDSVRRERLISSRSGSVKPIPPAEAGSGRSKASSALPVKPSSPRYISSITARWPRFLSASVTLRPVESETSRSGESPPQSTAIFTRIPPAQYISTARRGLQNQAPVNFLVKYELPCAQTCDIIGLDMCW